uniref:Phosphoglycerate kinase n=1 Tax=Heterorhabditis bacteriophora TaxID=37862 RepID=A0A1I7XNN1_HETBA
METSAHSLLAEKKLWIITCVPCITPINLRRPIPYRIFELNIGAERESNEKVVRNDTEKEADAVIQFLSIWLEKCCRTVRWEFIQANCV